MTAPPTFLDDPILAKRLGLIPGARPDATGVGMPSPELPAIQSKLDSLLSAYAASRQNLAGQMGGKLSALDVLGMATGGDADAKTMMRVANREAPDARRKLAKAATRKAKFGKGGK